jgi:hypothetical protein
MKTYRLSHLILVTLVVFLLACGVAIAASRTIQSNGTQSGNCAESCKARRDKGLERCDAAPEDKREKCREIVNLQYDKCAERCAERAR